MRALPREIPLAFEAGGASSRDVEWGDMNVAYERLPAGLDTEPLFKGLPDNRCQCPHWGYVFQGRFRVRYAEREEVVAAGEAYYLPPGHNVVVEQDAELVEFSPRGEYQKTLAVIERNMAAAR